MREGLPPAPHSRREWAEDMSEKERVIIAAAKDVIARYGFKRATMNDIAAAADMSRQTLYKVFSSKEDVLRGAIRHGCVDATAAIMEEWADASSLGERLDSFFAHTVVHPYVFIHSHPDADDMVSGFNEAGKEELAKSYARYQAMLAEIFSAYRGSIEAAGLSVDQLAEVVTISSRSFKYNAEDKAHLDALLASLKALVLTTTGEQLAAIRPLETAE